MNWPQHPTGYYWVRPLEPSNTKFFTDWHVISWFAATEKMNPVIATLGPCHDSLLESQEELIQFLETHEWGGPVLQPNHPDFRNQPQRYTHRFTK